MPFLVQMSLRGESEDLHRLVRRLRFDFDDTSHVNALYQKWRAKREQVVREQIDLWAYLFVRRYFLNKFIREEGYPVSDFDEQVTLAFERVMSKEASIREEHRYTSWVSVVCRNTYLNYLRSRRRSIVLVEENIEDDQPLPDTSAYDEVVIREEVRRAIARLPEYLREAVVRRILLRESYESIAKALDKSVPTLRSYVHKGSNLLREDPDIQELL